NLNHRKFCAEEQGAPHLFPPASHQDGGSGRVVAVRCFCGESWTEHNKSIEEQGNRTMNALMHCNRQHCPSLLPSRFRLAKRSASEPPLTASAGWCRLPVAPCWVNDSPARY